MTESQLYVVKSSSEIMDRSRDSVINSEMFWIRCITLRISVYFVFVHHQVVSSVVHQCLQERTNFNTVYMVLSWQSVEVLLLTSLWYGISSPVALKFLAGSSMVGLGSQDLRPILNYPSMYSSIFQVVLFLQVFLQKLCIHFFFPSMWATYPTHLILLIWLF
jgi:hypothetical protein